MTSEKGKSRKKKGGRTLQEIFDRTWLNDLTHAFKEHPELLEKFGLKSGSRAEIVKWLQDREKRRKTGTG